MKNQEPKSSIIQSSIRRLTEYEKQFQCPINMTIMENPTMITLCGHTFQLSAITYYISNKGECPICRKQVTLKDLCCNYSLKTIINTYNKSIQLKQQLRKAQGLEQAQKLKSQIQQKYKQNKVIMKNEGEEREIIKLNTSIKNLNRNNVIRNAINEYHEQTLIKIKQKNKNKNNIKDPKIPQFEHKINELMSQNELKGIAKKTLAFFKLQTEQKGLQIIRKVDSIEIIYENYRIQWAFDNSSIRFGQHQLNQKDKKTLNGFALFIQTGLFIKSGIFKNDQLNGKGKRCDADGWTQQGDFQDHRLNGKGKKCTANGVTYQGDFKDGKLNGKGKRCSANGNIFQGDFKDDKLSGKGKYCDANGSTYQGDFQDDKLNGRGKKCFADGSTYQGDFKDDKLNGKGKYCSANGLTQQGDFKDDKLNGKGKKYYVNGYTQQGDFQDGKKL